MKKPYNKITVGFVVQRYSGDGVCLAQEFVAGDQVDREGQDSTPVDPSSIIAEKCCCFDMVQPVDGDTPKCSK